MPCSECRRLTCICSDNDLLTDIYGTEVIGGEDYLINNHDEVIHVKNAVRYLTEDGTHQLKTR